MMSRRAFWQVSGLNALICRLMSPSHQSALSLSLGKSFISCRRRGLCWASPKRASNRLLPTPTVMVSPSGGICLPKMPLLGGGSLSSISAISPPWVRNSMRAVSVRKKFSSSLVFLASTSKAQSVPKGCSLSGVMMPAWCAPWQGMLTLECPLPPQASLLAGVGFDAPLAGLLLGLVAGCCWQAIRLPVARVAPTAAAVLNRARLLGDWSCSLMVEFPLLLFGLALVEARLVVSGCLMYCDCDIWARARQDRQPEICIRVSTACWQAVRWQNKREKAA